MTDSLWTMATSLPSGFAKFWHLKTSCPGFTVNCTVVTVTDGWRSCGGGGSAVDVGAGGALVVVGAAEGGLDAVGAGDVEEAVGAGVVGAGGGLPGISGAAQLSVALHGFGLDEYGAPGAASSAAQPNRSEARKRIAARMSTLPVR
jgi:hypothetical protein